MNFAKLIESLARVNKEGYQDNKPTSVGSLIKNLRKSKNITQSEICENVCSVSYTSKLEMNKIKPASDILHTLMERVGLPEETIIVLKNQDDYLRRTVDAFYLNDEVELKSLYDEMLLTEHLQVSQVVMLGYLVKKGMHAEARKIIRQNMELISSMTKTLVNVFSLFTAIELFNDGMIRDALEIALRLPLNKESDRYSVLVKELLFSIFVSLSRGFEAVELYNDLILILSKEGNFERIRDVNMKYLKLLFDTEEYRKIIEINEKSGMFDSFRKDSAYNMMVGVAYYACKELINAKYYLDQVKIGSLEFVYCVEYKYQYQIDKEAFIEMVEDYNKVNEDFRLTYFLAKVKGENVLWTFNTEAYKNALKNASFKDKKKLKRLKALRYMEAKKYKEACMILTQIEKEEAQIEELLLKRR